MQNSRLSLLSKQRIYRTIKPLYQEAKHMQIHWNWRNRIIIKCYQTFSWHSLTKLFCGMSNFRFSNKILFLVHPNSHVDIVYIILYYISFIELVSQYVFSKNMYIFKIYQQNKKLYTLKNPFHWIKVLGYGKTKVWLTQRQKFSLDLIFCFIKQKFVHVQARICLIQPNGFFNVCIIRHYWSNFDPLVFGQCSYLAL